MCRKSAHTVYANARISAYRLILKHLKFVLPSQSATITEPEYEQLKLSADPKKHPINKDRYVFSYGGKVLEVDVFPFWNDKAFLEIELDSEDDNYSIPPEIHIIKDVSDDPEYKNRKLANNK